MQSPVSDDVLVGRLYQMWDGENPLFLCHTVNKMHFVTLCDIIALTVQIHHCGIKEEKGKKTFKKKLN